jgi:hypothetical protein
MQKKHWRGFSEIEIRAIFFNLEKSKWKMCKSSI